MHVWWYNLKKFLIFFDILGFGPLPRKLAEVSGFEEDFVREVCFSEPLRKKVEEIKREHEVIEGTDDYVVIADDLASVSKVIKKITTIKIPHRDYEFVPFEIAVDIRPFKEQEIKNINRKEIIEFYKNDIVSPYKRYYKSKYNESVKETFVVYTTEFYKELELKSRHLFSEQIEFNGSIFFLADLEIMRDIESSIHDNKINVKKFKLTVTKHFEVKALIFKSLDNSNWKIQFLYVRILADGPAILPAVITQHLKLVHSIHGLNQLNNFLDQLTVGKEITLGQISGSLHLIPNRIKYDVYDGTTSSTRDFGINEPGHMLFKAGNTSIELVAVEQHLGSELRSHNPIYENLQEILLFLMSIN